MKYTIEDIKNIREEAKTNNPAVDYDNLLNSLFNSYANHRVTGTISEHINVVYGTMFNNIFQDMDKYVKKEVSNFYEHSWKGLYKNGR